MSRHSGGREAERKRDQEINGEADGGENKILRLRETGRERIRQERERSKTNSEAAETRRETLNKGEGNPVVEK